MLIKELKPTLLETVGRKWRVARTVLQLVWFASIPLYIFLDANVGFYTLLTSSVGLSVLTGREYLVSAVQRIRTTTALRERLLTFGDGEYVLNTIKQDQIWRGDTVDPEIESRLKQFEDLRQLAAELRNHKVEDKTQN